MIEIKEWPFKIYLTGDVIGLLPVELRISPTSDFNTKVLKRLDLCVSTFIDLAKRGGFSGDKQQPVKTEVSCMLTESAVVKGTEIVWCFSSLIIDPLSLVVLFNLIDGAEVPLKAVVMTSNNGEYRFQLSKDAYPPMIQVRPFQLTYERTNIDVDVEVVFRDVVIDSIKEVIIDTVRSWMTVGILGGFRRSDSLPLDSIMFPDNETYISGDTLEFTIQGVTAHDGAFDSLINTFVWVSDTILKIEEVNIQ